MKVLSCIVLSFFFLYKAYTSMYFSTFWARKNFQLCKIYKIIKKKATAVDDDCTFLNFPFCKVHSTSMRLILDDDVVGEKYHSPVRNECVMEASRK